jgi:hypothetical protein
LQETARQVTSHVLDEVGNAPKSSTPADSSATTSLEAESSDGHPRTNQSNSLTAVSLSHSGDPPAMKVDAKHRPSVVKYSKEAVDGELEAPEELDMSVSRTEKSHNDEMLKSRSLPLRSERTNENRKASRPSSSKRTTSKESTKSKS